MNKWDGDTEFREHTIEKVESMSDGGWLVTFDGGWCFGIPADSPVEPKVGATIRQYGRGSIRGCFIDGRCVFYRTEAEQHAKRLAAAEAANQKRREEFEASREDMDRRYTALPECFRDRIDRFRNNNPDFRWEFESYELFTCEQAVVIAETLGTEDAILAFLGLDWQQQKAAVPGLDDGHSGNTFEMACRLALDYLSNHDNVRQRHGALAPLVGSKAYGCVPRGGRSDDER